MTEQKNNERLRFESDVDCLKWVMDFCKEKKMRVLWWEPLSKDIYKHLRQVISPKKVSSRDLYHAIRFHIKSIKYLQKLWEGSKRYGLRGKEDGVVTAEEAAYAREELNKHHAAFMAEKRAMNRKKRVVRSAKNINDTRSTVKTSRGKRAASGKSDGDKPGLKGRKLTLRPKDKPQD